MSDQAPWLSPLLRLHAERLVASYARWTGRALVDVRGETLSATLFESEIVVVSHGTEADPILNYGNRKALALWELDWEAFIRTPSRHTAEPVHRDARQVLLDRVAAHGYIDDYCGVRVSSSGRRFRIEEATVWTVVDELGASIGQAAAFARYTDL